MEQTYYVNVLFGRDKARIFQKIKSMLTPSADYQFQIKPSRINPLSELSNSNAMRDNITRDLEYMNDINSSTFRGKFSLPFLNVIFVNYTTAELQPALKFNRIRLYLCDYIDAANIELLTTVNPIFLNFLHKARLNYSELNINRYFVNYSILSFQDTDADRYIANATTLDIAEETDDDVMFLLHARLRDTHLTDDEDARGGGALSNSIILPYHPFRHSLFLAVQNVKDNINVILLSQKNNHLIYFPFGQDEWLRILQQLMYERIFINKLISEAIYKNEKIKIITDTGYSRSVMSYNYCFFNRVQKKYKTHVLNDIVFDYSDAFNTVFANNKWYNRETKFLNSQQSPQFAMDVTCLHASNEMMV